LLEAEQKWLALVAVSVGMLVTVANLSIVGIALPTISTALQTDLVTVGWVQLSYQLVIAGLLPGLGHVADRVGRKRMYIVGLSTFVWGSLLAAISQDVTCLIGSRVIQAIGAAMTIANNRAILTFAFPPLERGRALGALQIASGGGTMLALALGGIIVGRLGWQWVFLLLVPLGLLGTLLAFLLLQEQKSEQVTQRVDWLGAIVLFCGLVLLVFVLSRLGVQGWRSPWVRFASVGILACTGVFCLHERRTSHPVLDWQLFTRPGFSEANLGSLLCHASRSAVMFLAPFQFERVLGLEPSQVGSVLVALPLAELLLAPLSGWWSDRSGSWLPATCGMLLVSLCLLALALLPTASSIAAVASTIALLGVGFGLFHSANNSLAMGAAPTKQLSMAASTLATSITLGMGIGVALASTILDIRFDTYVAFGYSASSAFAGAVNYVYLCTAGLSVLALFSSLFSRRTDSGKARLLSG
jgi:EmrB/QacA subfamily drug resistance transporter